MDWVWSVSKRKTTEIKYGVAIYCFARNCRRKLDYKKKLSARELMLLNCGVGEDS